VKQVVCEAWRACFLSNCCHSCEVLLPQGGTVIADVARAVAAILESEQISGVAPAVSFDAPKKDWAAARTSPTFNLFLADIREDLGRRTTTLLEETDADGVVEYYRQPFRFYDVTFTLTAWSNRPEDDFVLLGLALTTLNRYDYVPIEFCTDALKEFLNEGHVLNMRVGGKIFSDRFATELWSAMGSDFHPIISVVVTLPIPAGVSEPAGPPQTQPPKIAVSNTSNSASEEIRGRDPQDPDQGLRTRTRAVKS
jgi:hypothetical protein